MTQSAAPSPWATLRFRRARDVRGWALLGVPALLYPRVTQRLFEQQARFIEKHQQGEFIHILFEAPVELAAQLALCFPAPLGSEPLRISEGGDRILYGKAANSPKAQPQAAAPEPSLGEIAEQEGFWRAVRQLATASSFDWSIAETVTPSPGREPDPDPNLEHPEDWAAAGWEIDAWEEEQEPAEQESEAPEGQTKDDQGFEDIWIESEAEALEKISEEATPEVPEEIPEEVPAEIPAAIPEEPTVVTMAPFPLAAIRGAAIRGAAELAAADPPEHVVVPTAVNRVLGHLTLQEAIAQQYLHQQHPHPPPPQPPPQPPLPSPRLQLQRAGRETLTAPPPPQPPTPAPPPDKLFQGDPFQIDLLRYDGVEAWNHWRSHQPHIRPNLRGAYLNHLDLRWANLQDADLRFAFLFYADLLEAKLCGASLLGADLIHANLEAADLRYASLCGAYLSYANLYRADLRHTDLRGTFLHGAQLGKARLPRGS